MQHPICTSRSANTSSSDYRDVVHWGEIFPPFCNHKLDHDVAAWLFDCDRLLLSLATVGRDLARFSDDFEAVAIRGLATLDSDLLDSTWLEANFIDDLRLLELNRELLREHARRQPVRVIVPKSREAMQKVNMFWSQSDDLSIFCFGVVLTRERWLGQISHRSSWRKQSPLFVAKIQIQF